MCNNNKQFVPIDTTKPLEVLVTVYKHDFSNNNDSKIPMAKTSLWFKNTEELLDWSDNSGVEFSRC